MADLASREGVPQLELPTLVQPISPSADRAALRSLRALIADFQPDIVHTHTAKAGLLGRAAALRQSRDGECPILVHTYHGHVLEGYFDPVRNAIFRRLERRLAKQSDRLIGVSQQTVDDLVRLRIAPVEKFSVVRLGLNLGPFDRIGATERNAVRAELGVEPGEVLVGFFGRLVPIKRVDLLLEAVAVARRGSAPLRLLIAGDGAARDQLEARARRLGIAPAVSFLGYRRDLPELTAAIDLAAISSASEGTPVALIEAGAAGVPAVSTRVGGVAEVVIDGRTGLLVDPGDANALGNAIAKLAHDPGRRAEMGAAARRHILGRYSIERLLGEIDALYTDLVTARRSSST